MSTRTFRASGDLTQEPVIGPIYTVRRINPYKSEKHMARQGERKQMGMIDYVKTPHMKCPTCGSDPEWESRTRDRPQCEDVTVAELMANEPEHFDGRHRVSMVGYCTRCNYYIEVYIYGEIIVDGDAEAVPQRAITT